MQNCKFTNIFIAGFIFSLQIICVQNCTHNNVEKCRDLNFKPSQINSENTQKNWISMICMTHDTQNQKYQYLQLHTNLGYWINE